MSEEKFDSESSFRFQLLRLVAENRYHIFHKSDYRHNIKVIDLETLKSTKSDSAVLYLKCTECEQGHSHSGEAKCWTFLPSDRAKTGQEENMWLQYCHQLGKRPRVDSQW